MEWHVSPKRVYKVSWPRTTLSRFYDIGVKHMNMFVHTLGFRMFSISTNATGNTNYHNGAKKRIVFNVTIETKSAQGRLAGIAGIYI
jgi:hypothetical protein